MAVRVVLERVAIAKLLKSPTGPVARDALKRGKRVQALARALVGKNTGRLAASIDVRLRTRSGGLVVTIGTNLDYAMYVHDGTGVYGPAHRPIRPRRGHVMMFHSGSGGVVFAREVRGQRGTKYLERAIIAAR